MLYENVWENYLFMKYYSTKKYKLAAVNICNGYEFSPIYIFYIIAKRFLFWF